MKASQRYCRTTDGELVVESDPRAEFLEIPEGDQVPDEWIDAVEALEGNVEPEEVGDDTEPMNADVVAPSNRATVAEWQAYATTMGIDPEGMTKAELIDAVEALEV